MQKGWSEVAKDGVKSFISRWKSDTGPVPGQNDNFPHPSVSDASTAQSHRVQMPQQVLSPRYLTRNVKGYLERNDNVECGPIEIASDEEDGATKEKEIPARIGLKTKQTGHRVSAAISHDRATKSESRDEARLLGGTTSRDPGAVPIQDPMKRGFNFKSGSVYRPVDTLDGGPGRTRSEHILQMTAQHRVPAHPSNAKVTTKNEFRANDHATPNKRLKVQDPRDLGNTVDSAISLDDSQVLDDSGDELRLSPRASEGRVARQQRGHRHDGNKTVTPFMRRRQPNPTEPRQPVRSSPEDEGEFTKVSAQQRKAEKDRILGSSSPASQHSTAVVATFSSPYFSGAGTSSTPDGAGQKRDRQKAIEQESPDVLQSDHSLGVSRPDLRSRASLSQMPARELKTLIMGKSSSTAINKPSKSRTEKTANEPTAFQLTEFVYRDIPNAAIYVVEVNTEQEEISITTEDKLLDHGHPMFLRPVKKIVFIQHGTDLVVLKFSRTGPSEDTMGLRFKSEKSAIDFVKFLQSLDRGLKVKARDLEWMESAFANMKAADYHVKQDETRATASRGTASSSLRLAISASAKTNAGEKPKRLVDSLDPPRQASALPTTISGAERSMRPDASIPPHRGQKREPPRYSTSPERQVEPQARRVTRSRDSIQQMATAEVDAPPKVKLSETGILGKPWARDLVYPQPGKKSATVPFDDLRRLDDDEFLNDNLISFFIQYLETHLEKNRPDLYKRMHFFNTYFYEALTKNSKGKKGINFDSVSRWTKNINIFSRDFVIVPVNENFHWYLAIICNLPQLLRDSEDESGDLQLVDGTPSFGQQFHDTEKAADAPTEETQRSLAELSISDGERSSQPPAKGHLKKGPGRRKPVRRSLPKYETDKPIIITLDSLGSARSATCAFLKQYVVLEGKDKKALDLDVADLRGMTAKEIPTQGNFSDCGLYLCMYLEQFAADPYTFVRRILQREENSQQWPRKIQSQDLRSRLRDLILEIHRRQEQEPSTMEVPEVGSIMIQKREGSPDPVVIQKTQSRQVIEQARLRFTEIANANDAKRLAGHKEPSVTERPGVTTAEPQVRATKTTAATATEIPNTPEEQQGSAAMVSTKYTSGPQSQPRPHPKPNPSSSNSIVLVKSSPGRHTTSFSAQSHDSPGELAEIIRRGNESSKRRRTSARDDLGKQRSRSQSEPNDLLLLPSIESYARWNSASPSTSGSAKQGPGDRDSPEPQVVSERKINSDEALLGSRKRKRQEQPTEKKEQQKGGSDDHALSSESEVAETQDGGHDAGARAEEYERVRGHGQESVCIFQDREEDVHRGQPGPAGPPGRAKAAAARRGTKAPDEDGEMLLR